ncbi:FAD-dependent oxidoreductase [Ancylobacter sp. SL191]|uniref:FAD-dependent oxidoreductase n=1 Tax=Ancylobacter sp. SL191 TaxID=2995166 RepID=UPI00226FD0D9|nr:FAD-dependent oxidoreductase [Ancylobacter sp. SL191]WAC29277.1 FAD-dependent oxidoreductase [Ancylobacter sp. SL191]
MPSVVISGAGAAGLAAAWWLARAGWRVTVVERASDLRTGGYMMSLSGPGHAAAARMGLVSKLEPLAYTVEENVYRDRRGREVLRLRFHDFIEGLDYLVMRRTDLIAALRADLPEGVDIRLGTMIADVEDSPDGASVRFSDGATCKADLVLLADGMRSALRNRLFAPDSDCLKPLGYRFAVYELKDRLGLGADFVSYAEPGHIAEYYTLAEGRVAALHVWHSHETGPVPAADRWELLSQVCARSHPTVHAQLIAAREEGAVPLVDDLALVDLPRWSTGRVLLLGDAAHCLTLISGQGAGMALTSAAILADALGRSAIPEALVEHEARLRPSIIRLQDRSRKMAGMFVPHSPVAFELRNLFMRHVPRKWIGRYFINAVNAEILAAKGADG